MDAEKHCHNNRSYLGDCDSDDSRVVRILLRVNSSLLLSLAHSNYSHSVCNIQSNSSANATYSDRMPAAECVYELLGALVDSFLSPRPWWRVEREPYLFMHNPQLKNHPQSRKNSSSIVRWPAWLAVSLRRWPLWDSALRLLGAVQYPSEARCGQAAVTVGRKGCVHPGWHSVVTNYDMARGSRPFDPFAVFVPLQPNPKPGAGATNAFMTAEDCSPGRSRSADIEWPGPGPEEVNLWTCAFLPPTNCSLPRLVTQCKERACMADNAHFSSLFYPANSSGSAANRTRAPLLPPSQPFSDQVSFLHQVGDDALPACLLGTALSALSDLFTGQESGRLPRCLAMLPFDKRALNHSSFPAPADPSQLFTFLLLLRQAYFYRSRISERLHALRLRTLRASNGSSWPWTPCVAAHVRRGDRVMYSKAGLAVNMTAYCLNASLSSPANRCVDERDRLRPCPALSSLADYGCGAGNVPFGAVTVLDVLHRAEMLAPPSVRNLVLLSDDWEWVDEQVLIARQQRPEWTLHVLPAPAKPARRLFGTPKDYHFVRSQAGTESGLHFHASIRLAQQCQGLVAHFGSGIATMIFRSMCFSHAGIYGVCPPVYDLGKT